MFPTVSRFSIFVSKFENLRGRRYQLERCDTRVTRAATSMRVYSRPHAQHKLTLY